VAIGFRMNLFNIGVDGQYRIAAFFAAVLGGALTTPGWISIPLIILCAMGTGAVWAGIAGVLKVTRGVSEVISTIMLNFVATGLIAFLISTDSFGVLRGNNISTQPIAPTGQVPGIPFGGSGTLFGLIFLSAALGVGYWFLLERTRFGFDLKASGESPTAAAAGGVNARRMVIIALLLSGAVAGLVGLPELLGRDLAYTLNSPAGYGFTGIAIALLGRNHPVGMALGALVWAFLDKSALALDNVGVAREIVLIMQGSIVLSVVVAYEIVRRYELAAEQRRVAAQLHARAAEPAGVGSPGPGSSGGAS
jgi:simple sugar transport system permease protein